MSRVSSQSLAQPLKPCRGSATREKEAPDGILAAEARRAPPVGRLLTLQSLADASGHAARLGTAAPAQAQPETALPEVAQTAPPVQRLAALQRLADGTNPIVQFEDGGKETSEASEDTEKAVASGTASDGADSSEDSSVSIDMSGLTSTEAGSRAGDAAGPAESSSYSSYTVAGSDALSTSSSDGGDDEGANQDAGGGKRVLSRPMTGRVFNDWANTLASAGVYFTDQADALTGTGGVLIMMGSLATVVASVYDLITKIDEEHGEDSREEDKSFVAKGALVGQALSGASNLISGALALTSVLQSGEDADASSRHSALAMAIGEGFAMLADTYGAYKRYEKDGRGSAGFVLQASKLVTSLMKIIGCLMVVFSENDEDLGDAGTWIVLAFSMLSTILGAAKIVLVMKGKIRPLAEDPETSGMVHGGGQEAEPSSSYSDSERANESSSYSASTGDRLPEV